MEHSKEHHDAALLCPARHPVRGRLCHIHGSGQLLELGAALCCTPLQGPPGGSRWTWVSVHALPAQFLGVTALHQHDSNGVSNAGTEELEEQQLSTCMLLVPGERFLN